MQCCACKEWLKFYIYIWVYFKNGLLSNMQFCNEHLPILLSLGGDWFVDCNLTAS